MTHDRDFKNVVRRRMQKTGESYAAARARLVAGGAPASAEASREEPPFARFTERAKHVLSHAQQAAEEEGVKEIRPDHMLLGLLDEPEGLAAKVLKSAGQDLTALRTRVIRPRTGRVPKMVLPGPATKRVVDLAARDSARRGHGYIGTEHLLIGLVEAGTLRGTGVPSRRVRTLTDKLLAGIEPTPAPPAFRPQPRMPSVILGAEIDRARQIAAAESAPLIEAEHLGRALTAPDSELGAVLTSHGLDAESLQGPDLAGRGGEGCCRPGHNAHRQGEGDRRWGL